MKDCGQVGEVSFLPFRPSILLPILSHKHDANLGTLSPNDSAWKDVPGQTAYQCLTELEGEAQCYHLWPGG